MIRFVIVALIATVIFSCNSRTNKMLVYPEDTDGIETTIKKDTSLIDIADLPITVDSLDYLLHPIGAYKLYSGRGKIFKSESSGSFNFSSYGTRGLSGEIFNIKFENIVSGEVNTLTSENIVISNLDFLKELNESISKKIFIYKVRDSDSNLDGKLNYEDIVSLYFSLEDGKMFTKLSPKFHNLLNWKEVPEKGRVYFRTIEDSNKNGEFDKEDSMHYYYVEFTKDIPEIVEYDPLNNKF